MGNYESPITFSAINNVVKAESPLATGTRYPPLRPNVPPHFPRVRFHFDSRSRESKKIWYKLNLFDIQLMTETFFMEGKQKVSLYSGMINELFTLFAPGTPLLAGSTLLYSDLGQINWFSLFQISEILEEKKFFISPRKLMTFPRCLKTTPDSVVWLWSSSRTVSDMHFLNHCFRGCIWMGSWVEILKSIG